MQALLFATVVEESDEGSITHPLNPDEYDSPGWKLVATHRFLANLWNTTEHPRPVFGIETCIAAETLHILCAMHTSCATTVLLDNKNLLLFQMVKQADIVVTNPPFSLFREYVAQLVRFNKQFLIIGSMNAITYKQIFPLIRDNRMWYGPSISSGDREFGVPPHYPLTAASSRVDEAGNRFVRVKGVR